VAEVTVDGAIDEQTRCPHHDADRDVVAFRFACCGDWYPCRACHDERTEHETQTWGPGELDTHAVHCGVCESSMTIDTYVACQHTCPLCGASFNQGCRDHWEAYFELPVEP